MKPQFGIGLAAALSLAACASVQKVVEAPAPAPMPAIVAAAPATAPPPLAPVVRRVPVRIACVPRNLSAAPRYPDSDAALRAAGGAADRYQLMAAGRLMRERRLAELERVVEACRRVAPRAGAK
jgi:hypothetical protein